MRTARLAVLAALVLFTFAASPDELQSPDARRILKSIAGKENLPAGEVFKNVQMMKDVPAARFLQIMDMGFSRGLGVDCSHCHAEDRWDADEKRTKRAARDMQAMLRDINQSLGKMDNLEDERPSISCSTCHRGHATPQPYVAGK